MLDQLWLACSDNEGSTVYNSTLARADAVGACYTPVKTIHIRSWGARMAMRSFHGYRSDVLTGPAAEFTKEDVNITFRA